MKRTAAILFFAILLFNWIGYRFVIDFFEREHTRELQVSFDTNKYDESELISVKMHYPLPYLVNSSQFERWDGEVDIDGILYKYVKRRFVNDSIEFLCLPDYKSMRMQTARDNFFRLAHDLQQNRSDKKSDQGSVPSFKNILNDYCNEIKSWDFSIAKLRLSHHPFYRFFNTDYFGTSPGQPPDHIC